MRQRTHRDALNCLSLVIQLHCAFEPNASGGDFDLDYAGRTRGLELSAGAGGVSTITGSMVGTDACRASSRR